MKQPEKVANDWLVQHLAKYGYAPCKRTPDIWQYATRPMVFALCVDDFGMKYVGKQHANHLMDALCARYKIKCDWTGSLYLGLTIDWGYKRRRIKIPMSEYTPNVLLRFKYLTSIFNQDILHACARVMYGKPQSTMQEDSDPNFHHLLYAQYYS